MSNLVKSLLTGVVVLIAVGIVALKYRHYLANPWTRDGQVRAQVVQINPRVSGPIIHLPVTDNQFVQAGDLLFEIDPRTFKAQVDQAKAQLNVANVKVSNAQSEAQRYRAAQADSPGAVSAEELQLKDDTV
jgi:multidrug resistance efflux pump